MNSKLNQNFGDNVSHGYSEGNSRGAQRKMKAGVSHNTLPELNDKFKAVNNHVNEDLEVKSNASAIRSSARKIEKQYTWH